MSDTNRTHKIQIRVTPGERELLKEIASRVSLPLSSWVRSASVLSAAAQLDLMKGRNDQSQTMNGDANELSE